MDLLNLVRDIDTQFIFLYIRINSYNKRTRNLSKQN